LLSLALIGLGGAVRATDSGLACPDWPFCYGKVIPRQADIPTDSGYTLWNVWLEHSHRLVASVVSTLIAVLVGWALVRFRDRPAVLWPAWRPWPRCSSRRRSGRWSCSTC
jgi:cytochrome c oxidase assembly protein subunit 15